MKQPNSTIMKFLKSKGIVLMMLFLSFLSYGSHMSDTGMMLNKEKSVLNSLDAPGGLSGFIDYDLDSDSGLMTFLITLPDSGVVGFEPETDVVITNGTLDRPIEEFNFGDGKEYYVYYIANVASGTIVTASVAEDAFTVNGVGNQTTSDSYVFEGGEPIPTPPSTGIENDRAALVALYNRTSGFLWLEQDGWNTDAPLSEWHGVYVDEDGRVIGLYLNSNRLFGNIPPEIGNMERLRNLFLKSNALIGSIPEEIGNLENLRELNLETNNLSGQIPNAIIDMPSINRFNIRANNFTFSDLEPNFNELWLKFRINRLNYRYYPQNRLGVASSSQTVAEGGLIDLKANPSLTSPNNRYRWVKDNQYLGIETKDLEISNATINDAGVYYYIVTNTNVPNLTIRSEPITVEIVEEIDPIDPVDPVDPVDVGQNIDNMGINIDHPTDYSEDKAFADAMRSHRSWSVTGEGVGHENGGDAPRDANGWPTTDAECLVYAGGAAGKNGTYKLSFVTNNASGVTVSSQNATISNKQVSGSTVRFDVLVSDSNNSIMYLDFTNTSGGVRDVKLMRPISVGSSQSYSENKVFTDQFIAMIAPFSIIRYMDWTSTNDNDDDVWGERTLWTDASQGNPPVIAGKDYSYQGRGASWESVIMLSNEANKDAWITIPHKADDNYLRNLAQLFRDGNEHTSGLNSNLKLYVEYSNETWNGIFSQTDETEAAGVANRALLEFDGTVENVGFLGARQKAKRSVEISLIFREEFGDDLMMSRIRPVMGFQQGASYFNGEILNFIDRFYNRRDARSTYTGTLHPVNYYIWGSGGSTYWYTVDDDGNGAVPSLDAIWESGTYDVNNFYDVIKRDMALSRSYGLEYIAYEGNSHYYTFDGDLPVILQADDDPRMVQEFKEHHQAFESLGGFSNVFFSTTAGGDQGFALTNSNTDLSTPKFQAILEMSNEEPQAVSYENEAPFSISGGNFDFTAKFASAGNNPYTILSNDSDNVGGYIFSVPSTGVYQLSISYTGNGTSGLVIEFDGNTIETFNSVSGAGTFTQTIPCSVNRMHSIRLVAVGNTIGGSITINTVAVNSGTAQNVVSNQFQNLLTPTSQVDLIKESSNLMFPNPANIGDNISIRDVKGKTVHVEISNMLRTLKSETVQVKNNTYIFNTSGLPSGIYIVRITSTEDNTTISKRLVIGSGK